MEYEREGNGEAILKLTTSIVAALAGWLMLALPVLAETPTHPLAGKIFDTRSGKLLSTNAGQAIELPTHNSVRLPNSEIGHAIFPRDAITLLGEVHDNPNIHAMRAHLIRRMSPFTGTGTSPLTQALVFEHISADQQPGLDQFNAFNKEARRLATAGDLFRFLNWEKSGWPPQKVFSRLFHEAVDSRRPILAGNPPKELTRNVAKQGLVALDPAVASRLGLDKPLAPDLQDDLLGELEASHCGLMPKTAFGNMGVAQRYRDANMADVALKAAAPHGNVVIFAGNGHVRTDRGIPWYIRQRAPNQKIISVAFVETEAGKTDPTAYGPRDPAGKPAADYVAFALPATREDPCEQMRNQMKK